MSKKLDPADPQPGVYYGLTPPEYDAIEAKRSTDLKKALQSPAHYAHHLQAPREVKAAWEEGHILHDALLEPEELEHSYGWYNATKGRDTKMYAAWKEDTGKIGIMADDIAMVQGIRENVKRHEVLGGMFHGAHSEVTVIWVEQGQLCKCKIDYLHDFPDGLVVIDLKSVGGRRESPASARQFRRTIAERDYEMSAAMYRRGVEAAFGKPVIDYVFAAVEKDPPYMVEGHTLDEDYLAIGDKAFEQALDVALRVEMDPSAVKPGYSDSLNVLSPPAWKRALYDV